MIKYNSRLYGIIDYSTILCSRIVGERKTSQNSDKSATFGFDGFQFSKNIFDFLEVTFDI